MKNRNRNIRTALAFLAVAFTGTAAAATQINVNPAAYAGKWSIVGATGQLSGAQTVSVEPGVHRVGIGIQGGFYIDVATGGAVTVRNGVSGVGGTGSLDFSNTAIAVEPLEFSGHWAISGVADWAPGPRQIVVVPGTKYAFNAGTQGTFWTTVAGDGTVSVDNGISGVGGLDSLTFNNTTLSVDPADFSGYWAISRVASFAPEAGEVTVVPGVKYQMLAGIWGGFQIKVEADDTVVVQNGVSAVGGVGSLIFNTSTISVEPGAYTGQWGLGYVTWYRVGPATLELVPGVRYQFQAASASKGFSVAEPCAVDPTQFALGGFTFDISCGLADGDADGVPDDTDLCPSVPDPDQLDQDLDGLGDACDADLDGDGFANELDVCPAISNADQADLDGDGFGDVCDADADGDAVPDDIDTCPFVANSDQADSEGDLVGDACDDDDDNDGVEDLADNCPLDANAHQEDFDANGQGDICDGEIDGDGVANGDDLCPLSPLDKPVNANGCTGAQHIVLQCTQDNFVQHGQYVSCVAHAAKQAVEDGLISSKEKAGFVKQAAKSKP
jgi:hypothetical protein